METALSGISEKLSREVAGALRGQFDLCQAFGCFAVGGQMHPGEAGVAQDAREQVVEVVRDASREDAEASYDYLRRIDYFEPTSKVSRKMLQNLIDMERSLGNIGPALTIDRLAMPGLTELVD